MARRKFSKPEVLEVRAEIARRYLHRQSQVDLARDLSLTPHMVNYYIAQLRIEWRVGAAEDIAQAQAEELARLDEVERCAWEALEKSCRKSVRETLVGLPQATSSQSPGAIQTVRAIKVSEEKAGDKAYLEIILKCIRARAELRGLKAPLQAEVKTTDDWLANLSNAEKMQLLLEGLTPLTDEEPGVLAKNRLNE